MYSSLAVANYFIDLAERDNEQITPMKMQKLVFFAHGWHLAFYNEPLIREYVEAWTWGPVIRELYFEFRSFGKSPITKKGTTFQVSDFLVLDFEIPEIEDKDEKAKDTINAVWAAYGKYDGLTLANMTHVEGTPWKKVWDSLEEHEKEGIGPKSIVIDNKIIKDYFYSLLQRSQDTA